MSPRHFDEFTAPYLAELIERIKQNGAISILHSDGNLMPIIDRLIDMKPHDDSSPEKYRKWTSGSGSARYDTSDPDIIDAEDYREIKQ